MHIPHFIGHVTIFGPEIGSQFENHDGMRSMKWAMHQHNLELASYTPFSLRFLDTVSLRTNIGGIVGHSAAITKSQRHKECR